MPGWMGGGDQGGFVGDNEGSCGQMEKKISVVDTKRLATIQKLNEANAARAHAATRARRKESTGRRSAYQREWWKNNPDKRKAYQITKTYGLSLEEFRRMVSDQNNVCAICRRPEGEHKYLCIDHNHTTGRIRGLLCKKCNTAIGFAREDVTILRNMVQYLEGYE